MKYSKNLGEVRCCYGEAKLEVVVYFDGTTYFFVKDEKGKPVGAFPLAEIKRIIDEALPPNSGKPADPRQPDR